MSAGQQRAADLLGMGLVAAGTSIFALIAVLVKLVHSALPNPLLLQLRYLIQLVISLAGLAARRWLAPTGPGNQISPREVGWLLLYGLNYWLYTVLYWAALQSLPLGDAITIVYLAPIWGTLLAWLAVGDKAPWSFVPCSLVAIGGGVLVARPSFLFGGPAGSREGLGIPCAVAAAILGGNIGVLAKMCPGRHWLELPLAGLLAGSLVLCPAFIATDAVGLGHAAEYQHIHWEPKLVLEVLAISSGGFAAIILQTEGYRRANYAVASLLGYAEIPLSFLLQILFFKDKVTVMGCVGAGLVLLATMVNAVVRIRTKADATDASMDVKPPPLVLDSVETRQLVADEPELESEVA